MGAYVKNSNPKIDRSIEKFPLFESFLKQNYEELLPREDSFSSLNLSFNEGIYFQA